MSDEGSTYKIGGWRAHYTLIICSLLYMVNYMDRQVLAAVLEPMRLDLGLTDTQVGLLQTVFLLSIAFFSLPVAFLIDRWSRRKAIAVMAIFWSVFTYVTGLARGFAGVLVARMLVGIGEAGFSSGGTALLSAAYSPASRGKVMGVFNLVIPVGIAIGFFLGGSLSAQFGWRSAFFVFAIPGIILGILAWFMKDYKTVTPVDVTGKQTGFLKTTSMLFKISTLKYLYIGFGIRNIMNFSVLTWMSAYLMRAQGIPVNVAGKLSAIIFLMAIFGAVIGGWLSDTWQKKNRRARMLLPAIADSLAAVVLIVATTMNLQGTGYIVMCFWGVMVMIGTPALNAVTQDVVSTAFKGTSFGMAVLCMYVFGGGWGPILVGKISDMLGGGAYGLQQAFYVVAIAGFVSTAIFLIGARSYEADMDKVKGDSLEAEA